ncbi:hypothetical protein J6590_093855 [Homalodisca vitripennis]|nr:hypothetical protein J6590_093855 [Homalodisca vitripennis]
MSKVIALNNCRRNYLWLIIIAARDHCYFTVITDPSPTLPPRAGPRNTANLLPRRSNFGSGQSGNWAARR